jgi:outer membrane autotransporter protein
LRLRVSLTTVGGHASSGAITLPPGIYTVTENPTTQFFAHVGLSCTDPDGGTTVDVATATATIDLDAGENITCTFTNLDPRPQTKAAIERFLHHRLTALFDDEPDRPRFLRRFPNSLWGGGSTSGGSPFDVAASESGGDVTFSTSLSQLAGFMAGADQSKQQSAMTLGSPAREERPAGPYRGIDIWTEAHFTRFNEDAGNADEDGHFNILYVGILYVGGDYPLSKNMLLGVLGEFDWGKQSSDFDRSKVEGEGWTVGPYLSARLDPHLFFDLRGAWGESNNDVNPFGLYTDSFDTTRWLTTARLTGNWTSDNWRLTPSVAVKYGEEEQQSYTDFYGVRIPGQTESLGRVEFGPEFGYRWDLADGTLIEPQLSIVGVWNFEDGGSFLVGDTLVSPDDFTGKVEAGVLVQLPKGMSFRATGAYDGFGGDYNAYSGRVWLNLPPN